MSRQPPGCAGPLLLRALATERECTHGPGSAIARRLRALAGWLEQADAAPGDAAPAGASASHSLARSQALDQEGPDNFHTPGPFGHSDRMCPHCELDDAHGHAVSPDGAVSPAHCNMCHRAYHTDSPCMTDRIAMSPDAVAALKALAKPVDVTASTFGGIRIITDPSMEPGSWRFLPVESNCGY